MNADQMVLEAISMGGPDRNQDALLDVQEAMDEGMLSDAVYDKARAWIKGIGAERDREYFRQKKRFMAAGGYVGPRVGKGKGKGKRGWIKLNGRWVATR